MRLFLRPEVVLTLLATAWGTMVCPAQQAPEPASDDGPVATLRVSSRTVEVSAVVRNKSGEPQTALQQGDFTVRVDGKEQPIQHFTVAGDLPLTLALLVDVSGSQRTFISDEWRASDMFFQQMLTRPQDRAMLVQIDARVLVLMPMTDNSQRLHLALTQLGQNSSTAGATLLNDAVAAVVQEKLAKEKGRKAIVLLTDGGDNGSRATLQAAIEQAQRANVQVYAVDYTDWTNPRMVPAGGGLSRFGTLQDDPGAALLKKLAESTGGRVYTVSHGMTLQHIFEQIAADLRTQYELGFAPSADLKPNSFHKLEVRTQDRKFGVQARNGFYVK